MTIDNNGRLDQRLFWPDISPSLCEKLLDGGHARQDARYVSRGWYAHVCRFLSSKWGRIVDKGGPYLCIEEQGCNFPLGLGSIG